jgi:hypothetical protein
MRISHIRNHLHTYSKPIFHPGFVLSDELPAGPFSRPKPTGETLPKDHALSLILNCGFIWNRQRPNDDGQ